MGFIEIFVNLHDISYWTFNCTKTTIIGKGGIAYITLHLCNKW